MKLDFCLAKKQTKKHGNVDILAAQNNIMYIYIFFFTDFENLVWKIIAKTNLLVQILSSFVNTDLINFSLVNNHT